MSNKKAEGINQVFIFILVALTFAVITIFGYKAIGDFLKSGEEVAFVQFKNDLETSIKRIYSEFGSVRERTFHLPGRYGQVCFVDMDYTTEQTMDGLREKDPVAYNAWEDVLAEGGYIASEQNVFLTPEGIKIKVYKISIADDESGSRGYLCLKTTLGSFSLRLEGKGDRTEISEIPLPEAVSSRN